LLCTLSKPSKVCSNLALLKTMPRALVLFCTIVAAFPGWLAAAPPISEDVPVTVEISAVARTLGIDPPSSRAQFAAELTRLLYTPPLSRSPRIQELVNPRLIDPILVEAERPMRVPIPLSVEIWGRVIFKRSVRAEDLLGLILTDRRAALLCYGLSALDDETLTYFGEHPNLLAQLHEQHAPVFAAFGASLRIRGGRLEPPGGAAARPIWEAVVHQSLASPEVFIRALFGMDEGRVAYLFDAITQAPSSNAAFALGLFLKDPAARILRFNALVDVITRSYREWRLETLPFSKPLHDVGIIITRARVGSDGTPVSPASRAFWSSVFTSDDLNPDSATLSGDANAEQPIDAAWLAQETSGNDMFWRGDRIDQFAFGQRVFAGTAPDSIPSAIVAIRAFPRQRMLSLTLERMGVTSPSVYAFAARQAQRLSATSPSRQFRVLAQVQSALALLARMTSNATLSSSQAEKLVQSLFNVPLNGDRYEGALITWLRRELLPLMPASADAADTRVIGAIEGGLIEGLAGRSTIRTAVEWEGQSYRLDLAAGERQRLRLVRRKQEGYSVDLALAIDSLARRLMAESVTVDDARNIASELAAFPDSYDHRLESPPETRAANVESSRRLRELTERWTQELTRAVRSNDVRRATRLAPAMIDVADEAFGDALLSLAYAADLGDPDGTAMLARNVALRHDFGFGRRDADARSRLGWAIPRQDFLPGVPWHVTGSVLGLDIALASLSLRRISADRLAEAPHLSSNERDAFAVSVSLMNARQLQDADRDAIVSAIARGRERVAGLTQGRERLATVADVVSMDGWRRRALAWMLVEDKSGIPSMFSLSELLVLGDGPPISTLHAWGTTALQAEGCACLRLTTPRTWRTFAGRPQMAFMAFGVADLNLHVAEVLASMGLPAALERHVLSAAVLDYIEEVTPADYNDWWAAARFAQTVPRELIEDYVASAAAVDGPLVPDETGAAVFH
jgi:hypothetical protein